jgi:hypothetical protein
VQNTSKNYENLLIKFIECLHARGHSIENLATIFEQAAAFITHNAKQELATNYR